MLDKARCRNSRNDADPSRAKEKHSCQFECSN